jgi:uncharacterized protein with GYD domain
MEDNTMDAYKETFSQYEIYNIIDAEIKAVMGRKNAYIQKNGYKHTDVLKQFDACISALSGLYGKFNQNGTY